jgi:hypothetical protein
MDQIVSYAEALSQNLEKVIIGKSRSIKMVESLVASVGHLVLFYFTKTRGSRFSPGRSSKKGGN